MNDYYTVKMEQLVVREDETLGPPLESIGQIDILHRDPAGAAKTMAEIMQRVEDILEMLSECEPAREEN